MNSVNYQLIFNQISENRQFEQLESYCDASFWSTLNQNDRNRLAYLFTLWGQDSLKKGETRFIDHFKTAAAVASDNPKILGLCSYFLGQHSEEAIDFHQAVSHFKNVSEKETEDPEFLCHYGNALVSLSGLIDRTEFLDEAVSCYKKAVKINPNLFVAWFNLATTHQRLFTLSARVDYFQLSDEFFTKALLLDKDSAITWFRWGHLYLNYGKIYRDLKFVEKALEKFEHADQLHPKHPILLRLWAEALMILGTHQEKLERLRQAEKIILSAFEIEPGNPEILYISGMCAYELGRYFEEERYLVKAKELFQEGLVIDRQNILLWHGLVLVHLSFAEIFQEAETYVKAIEHCNEASQNCIDLFPQFWNDWGVVLMKYSEITHDKHYLELAIEKFEHAIKKQGVRLGDKLCELEWFYNYACALDFLGDFEQDVELYERSIHILSQIIAIDSKYTHARYNLALALTHLGELVSEVECFNKALEQYQILLEQDPEDDAAWNDWGLALLNLAQLLYEDAHPELTLNLYEDSERKLNEAVKLGSLQAYYSLACLHSVKKNYELAIYYLEKAERAGSMPSISNLMHDEWLQDLTQAQIFRNFISNLMSKHNKET